MKKIVIEKPEAMLMQTRVYFFS